ncbi:hypothetical protein M406DRAFT_103824 [Cryphonectria parasitica EP155]|uniref:Uncharacterized protein n=1 Tax=Cryphonectria parasitica (strain ATCC 38755 / EP155) TaxID=660469 RepID=A0A9P4XYU0_CRYP1|nr:uncharacterized protein M406DRAFT_103824 [Cryphonectria parasitica EP155]KAF3763411.1 hypothetical protein M406DRAFT_103824 [Cryphonectria parasitica EP155]
MDTHAPSSGFDISTLTKDCSNLLEEWTGMAKSRSEAEFEVASSIRFRFNLWAQNNAALSRGLDSMDQRLRKAPVLRCKIIDLLEDFASSLRG